GMADLGQAEFLKAFARASRVDSTRQRDLAEIGRLKQNNDTMRQRLLTAIAERDHYLAALKARGIDPGPAPVPVAPVTAPAPEAAAPPPPPAAAAPPRPDPPPPPPPGRGGGAARAGRPGTGGSAIRVLVRRCGPRARGVGRSVACLRDRAVG